MTQVLHINSSLWGEQSRSYQLGAAFTAQYRDLHAVDRVVYRDLVTNPIPHITARQYEAYGKQRQQLSKAEQQLLSLSNQLIDEVKQSDVIVLGAPMYNFSIPSTLQAWIDHITRKEETFTYTDQGVKGLLTGKKLYVVSTRGGRHLGTQRETQTQQLRSAFSLMGITEVEFIYAEAMMGAPEAAAASWTAAEKQIDDLVRVDASATLSHNSVP